MRALITGISGFVGGHLAEHLRESGDEVLGTSSHGGWTLSSPEAIRNRTTPLRWDFSQPERDEQRIRRDIAAFRPDAIYHLAAVSVPKECGEEQPTPRAVQINVEGTRRVLELASSLAPRPRVLFVSSNHVYAPVAPDRPIVDEDARLAPRSAYGKTKLAAEQEVRCAVKAWGCRAVIARAFQHTGPGQSPQMMLPQWVEQFVRGDSPVKVRTRGARLDLADVRDVVRAYRLLIQYGSPGEVTNVGTGTLRTSGEILDLLRQMADPTRPIVELQPSLRQEPIADTARLVRLTGWRMMIPLEQTVADTLQWWREQF